MKTVGIFLHGQAGDVLTASSVLRYRDMLWRDAKIVWYISDDNRDLLKHHDIELRTFPRGYGYPKMVREENAKLNGTGKPMWEDWQPLVDKDNRMDIKLKESYPSLADIDIGYFPAPHQMTPVQRHGLDYPSCSKKVFDVPGHLEWHPCIILSAEEVSNAYNFIKRVGHGKKILIETFAGSGQSRLDEDMLVHAMNICSEAWPECKFIFASHKFLRGNEKFPEHIFEQDNVFSCADFTVRQCAGVANMCDLMLSVSSGITVAASAWTVMQPPILQFCGSWTCSTQTLAKGPFELVTADDKKLQVAKDQYFIKLVNMLKKYE